MMLLARSWSGMRSLVSAWLTVERATHGRCLFIAGLLDSSQAQAMLPSGLRPRQAQLPEGSLQQALQQPHALQLRKMPRRAWRWILSWLVHQPPAS